MPFSPKAHRFFALCATHPEKARGKCPSKSNSKRMMSEGIKRKAKAKKHHSGDY